VFEHVFVPLMLAESLGEVRGKTRFQKLVFLVQRGAEKEKTGFDLNFDIYLYGPFSQELSLVIDDLVRRGDIEESIEQIPPYYEMHTYKLTNKGREMLRDARTKKLMSTRIAHIVRDISEKYGHLPLAKLVEEAYRQF
jgi:uncharacterized protein YwgA